MNAEQLHSIAAQVISDVAQTNVVKAFSGLTNTLEQLSNNPADSGAQQNVSSAQSSMFESLDALAKRSWPAGVQQTVSELGGGIFVDESLRTTISEIIQANALTPVVAKDKINELHDEANTFIRRLNALVAAFTELGIEEVILDPGEVELGILIPRNEIDNHLHRFAEEVEELDKVLKLFSVVAIGTREELEITYISASDLKVFVRPSLRTATLISATVTFILTSLNQAADLKVKYDELVASGVSEQALEGLLGEINSRLEKDTDEYKVKLVDQFCQGKKEHDRREDENRLKIAIDHIAPRLERGYAIEIRVGELPPSESENEDGEEGDEPDEKRQAIDQLREEAQQLRRTQVLGKPVLQLPMPGSLSDALDC